MTFEVDELKLIEFNTFRGLRLANRFNNAPAHRKIYFASSALQATASVSGRIMPQFANLLFPASEDLIRTHLFNEFLNFIFLFNLLDRLGIALRELCFYPYEQATPTSTTFTTATISGPPKPQLKIMSRPPPSLIVPKIIRSALPSKDRSNF